MKPAGRSIGTNRIRSGLTGYPICSAAAIASSTEFNIDDPIKTGTYDDQTQTVPSQPVHPLYRLKSTLARARRQTPER
jgi:hypothetical protein